MEEILTVYVKIEEAASVEGYTGKAVMLQFSGYSRSKYFNGTVLPHAVDCQKCKKGDTLNLSARYILEGVDGEGCQCKIFIENSGKPDTFGNIHTVPLIYTDSQFLKWLETEKLTGHITNDGEFVVIHICREN